MRWWWTRHDRQGAVATEFVVVFPLFMILVLGTFSVGVAYFRQLNLVQAAREGAREAATLPTGYDVDEADPDEWDRDGIPTDDWLERVATTATEAAIGQWTHTCVAYTGLRARQDASELETRSLRWTVQDDGSLSEAFGTDICYADGREPQERRVQVRLETDTFFNAFVFVVPEGITLAGTSTARFEAVYPTVEN